MYTVSASIASRSIQGSFSVIISYIHIDTVSVHQKFHAVVMSIFRSLEKSCSAA